MYCTFQWATHFQLMWPAIDTGGPNPLPPVVICPITIVLLYYMGTDEIPGFLLVLKNHIFIALSDTIFIFHVLTSLWLLTRFTDYQRASSSGTRPVLLKSHSQNGFFKIHFCCYRIVFFFFIRILTFWNRQYMYYCLYFSFITIYSSFISFL